MGLPPAPSSSESPGTHKPCPLWASDRRERSPGSREKTEGTSLGDWTPVSDWGLGTGDQCSRLGTLHL